MTTDRPQLTLNEYQVTSKATAVYPRVRIIIDDGEPIEAPWVYPLLGLVGEAGEIAEKFKKIIRDNRGSVSEEHKQSILKELGDPLWYLARLGEATGWTMDQIGRLNLDKLFSRKQRGTLQGSGDDR